MADAVWTEQALEDLSSLDKPVRQRILKKIAWLSRNFEHIIPEPLSGEFQGTYKFRIGVWRAVYTQEQDTIIIHSIGHRRDIYRI